MRRRQIYAAQQAHAEPYASYQPMNVTYTDVLSSEVAEIAPKIAIPPLLVVKRKRGRPRKTERPVTP